MLIAQATTDSDALSPAMRQLVAHGLLVLMVVACLVGLVVITMLLRAWRRYNQRLDRPRPQRGPMPDVWRAAADRLGDPDPFDEDDDDRPDPLDEDDQPDPEDQIDDAPPPDR